MIPAIPVAYFAVTAVATAVTYIAKRSFDVIDTVISRPDRAAEREHELKMTEIKSDPDAPAVQAVMDELKKLREARARARAQAQPKADPATDTVKVAPSGIKSVADAQAFERNPSALIFTSKV
jgi:hypothetical protein